MFEITLAGPGKNALSSKMMTFILQKLHEANGAPVLLTGAGDAFSAGLDLREVASIEGEETSGFLRLLEGCMTALYLYPGPTVAAVNGHAIAGGCVLTLCCDHRVIGASPRIKVGLNEVALGVRFPPRVLAIVKNRLPRHNVEQVVLGASLVDPARARELGIVDEIAEDPVATARVRLAALASNPPEAYRLAKHDLRGTAQDLCPDEAWDRFFQWSIETWTAPELKQRIAKLLGK